MLIRISIPWCLLGAIVLLSGWLRPAAAQEERPPLERPAAKPLGDLEDFRGLRDGPLPKDGLRKPPRLGPDGLDPGGFPGPKPPPGEGRLQPPRDSRPAGGPQDFGPLGGPRGEGAMPGAPKGPPGAAGYDPEMAELDQADFELSRKTTDAVLRYRHAPVEDREQLKKELTELVNRHFDVRQQRRELQLKRLEEELQRLRESIEARSEAREQIVNKRIAELLGEKADLSF